MDDEEPVDTGLGGLAAFQLGRWSAQSSAGDLALIESLFGPRTPRLDVNQLLTDNKALAAENEQLRRELEDYKHNYGRLLAWAEQVEPLLKKAG